MRDQIRYTWYWGDGTFDVTAVNWAWHSYSRKTTFTLTVYMDDMTGLPGHNVSGSNNVLVVGTNTQPVLVSFTVNNNNPNVCQMVSFSGSATDADGDLLTYTFDFGDGNMAEVTGWSSPTVPLVLNATYWYTAPGPYSAYLYVTDSYSVPKTSPPQPMNVVLLNHAPVVVPLLEVSATPSYGIAFSASATDPDGDPLQYTWDFGDYTPLVVGNDVQHSYSLAGDYVFRVYVDDGTGFVGYNVTSSAWAHINGFTLTLVKGWNFVSVPFVSHGYKASTLPGLDTGDSVHGYNPATGTYKQAYIIGLSPPSVDFFIMPSTGYWIYAKAPRTLFLAGSSTSTPQERIIDVMATGGWAIIGLCTLKTNLYASNISYEMYSSTGVISTVSSYNPLTGKYQSYFRGVNSTNYLLTPGLAYWIYATADGTLHYSP